MMATDRRLWNPGRLAVAKIDKSLLHYSFLIGCLVFMWAIGISNLKALPIANDEFSTIIHVYDIGRDLAFSIPETLDKVSTVIPDHGPLYYVLMNLWLRIAGADLFAARLPSIFFAMLAAAVAYRLARIGGDLESSLIAAALMAFLAFFLYYASVARMYTILPLAAGVIVWSFWRVSQGKGKAGRWQWLLLFVSAASITYIHYSGALLLSAIGLYHLLFAKKNRRWLRMALVVSAAAILFLPWFPVVLDGLELSRGAMSATRLTFFESLGAGLAVYSNGIVVLPVISFALIARYRKRLKPAQRYVLLVLIFAVIVLLGLNEITPLLVESRLRYLTFLAAPAAVALAYGLRLLPLGKPLRIILLFAWVAASFAFSGSAVFDVFTNREELHEDHLVHYQAFLYDLRDLPGYNQLIISFHPEAPAVWKTLEYYRAILDRWHYVVHLSYDESGQLELQSGIPPRLTLEDIAENYYGVYAIHNPSQTDLNGLAVYSGWFLERYKSCKRYVDQPNNVIELYLQRRIPCGLPLAQNPLAIRYDNGMALANIVVESSEDALDVFFWWDEIHPSEFSYSLQAFDQEANKVLSEDAVIWREPFDARSLDISALPVGDYTLKLIVYDYETGLSQPGLVVGADQRFEREVEIARFSIGD